MLLPRLNFALAVTMAAELKWIDEIIQQIAWHLPVFLEFIILSECVCGRGCGCWCCGLVYAITIEILASSKASRRQIGNNNNSYNSQNEAIVANATTNRSHMCHKCVSAGNAHILAIINFVLFRLCPHVLTEKPPKNTFEKENQPMRNHFHCGWLLGTRNSWQYQQTAQSNDKYDLQSSCFWANSNKQTNKKYTKKILYQQNVARHNNI